MDLDKEHKFVQVRGLNTNKPSRVTKKTIDDLKALQGRHFFAEADVTTQTMYDLEQVPPQALQFTTEIPLPEYDMFEDLLQLFLDAEQRIDELYKSDVFEHDYRYNFILSCIEILYTQREEYGKLYSMWLSSQEETIADCISTIVYDSIDRVANAYSTVVVVLNTDLKGERAFMDKYYANMDSEEAKERIAKNPDAFYKQSTLDYMKKGREEAYNIARENYIKSKTPEQLKGKATIDYLKNIEELQ